MGRRSVLSKRLKRRKQKERKKLKDGTKRSVDSSAVTESENMETLISVETPISVGYKRDECERETVNQGESIRGAPSTEMSPVAEQEHNECRSTEVEYECIGEDVDVAMMHAEDGFIQMEHNQNMAQHSYEYLYQCREKLMEKVAHYRAVVEKKTTEMKRKEYEHRQQLERIRMFYQAMAYAPTRSARIFKKSYCSSSSAAEVLQHAGLMYKKHMLEYSNH